MLESFAYIRKNCLVVDPNDMYYKHDGRTEETKDLQEATQGLTLNGR